MRVAGSQAHRRREDDVQAEVVLGHLQRRRVDRGHARRRGAVRRRQLNRGPEGAQRGGRGTLRRRRKGRRIEDDLVAQTRVERKPRREAQRAVAHRIVSEHRGEPAGRPVAAGDLDAQERLPRLPRRGVVLQTRENLGRQALDSNGQRPGGRGAQSDPGVAASRVRLLPARLRARRREREGRRQDDGGPRRVRHRTQGSRQPYGRAAASRSNPPPGFSRSSIACDASSRSSCRTPAIDSMVWNGTPSVSGT